MNDRKCSDAKSTRKRRNIEKKDESQGQSVPDSPNQGGYNFQQMGVIKNKKVTPKSDSTLKSGAIPKQKINKRGTPDSQRDTSILANQTSLADSDNNEALLVQGKGGKAEVKTSGKKRKDTQQSAPLLQSQPRNNDHFKSKPVLPQRDNTSNSGAVPKQKINIRAQAERQLDTSPPKKVAQKGKANGLSREVSSLTRECLEERVPKIGEAPKQDILPKQEKRTRRPCKAVHRADRPVCGERNQTCACQGNTSQRTAPKITPRIQRANNDIISENCKAKAKRDVSADKPLLGLLELRKLQVGDGRCLFPRTATKLCNVERCYIHKKENDTLPMGKEKPRSQKKPNARESAKKTQEIHPSLMKSMWVASTRDTGYRPLTGDDFKLVPEDFFSGPDYEEKIKSLNKAAAEMPASKILIPEKLDSKIPTPEKADSKISTHEAYSPTATPDTDYSPISTPDTVYLSISSPETVDSQRSTPEMAFSQTSTSEKAESKTSASVYEPKSFYSHFSACSSVVEAPASNYEPKPFLSGFSWDLPILDDKEKKKKPSSTVLYNRNLKSRLAEVMANETARTEKGEAKKPDPKKDYRKKPATEFFARYKELCEEQNVRRTPAIMPTRIKLQRELNCNVDKIKLTEWKPIFGALKADKTLEKIRLVSRLSHKKLYVQLNTIDTVKNTKYRFGLPCSKYVLENLLQATGKHLTTNSNITILELTGLYLDNYYVEYILQGINLNESLTTLIFTNCNLSLACEKVCQAIRRKVRIQTLNMTNCKLGREAARWIADLLYQQHIERSSVKWESSLRYREVDNNGEDGVRTLILNSNPDMSDEGVKYIFLVLLDTSYVKNIQLQNCGITNNLQEFLLQTMRWNTGLTVVDLQFNTLDGVILDIIRDELQTRQPANPKLNPPLNVNKAQYQTLNISRHPRQVPSKPIIPRNIPKGKSARQKRNVQIQTVVREAEPVVTEPAEESSETNEASLVSIEELAESSENITGSFEELPEFFGEALARSDKLSTIDEVTERDDETPNLSVGNTSSDESYEMSIIRTEYTVSETSHSSDLPDNTDNDTNPTLDQLQENMLNQFSAACAEATEPESSENDYTSEDEVTKSLKVLSKRRRR